MSRMLMGLMIASMMALIICTGVPTPCLAADAPKPLLPPKPADPKPPVAPSPLDGPPLKDVPTWSELARAIVLTAIPDKYVDRKHWDKTREVFDGVRVQQRGFNIRMSERKRKVNHGAWYMYTIRFPNPEQNLKVIIDNVQSQKAGQFSFHVHVAMKKILLHGQFEQWVLGVKGINFDFESDVEVHLHAAVQMTIRTEVKKGSLLPDLVLDPSVRALRLNLVDVNTHRIGRMGGDIAEELGDSSRKFFEDLIHSQESRVIKKANEAIQKKRDSLRIPISKLW